MSARGAAMLALALNGTPVVDASRQLGATSRLVHPRPDEVTWSQQLLEKYLQASDQALQWRHVDAPGHAST
jgi:hypothetical protein